MAGSGGHIAAFRALLLPIKVASIPHATKSVLTVPGQIPLPTSM